MQSTEQYLKYASECDRLALLIPEHAQILREIAGTWRGLALQNKEKGSEGDGPGFRGIPPGL